MCDNEKEVLFKSLSKILSNQDNITKHLGLNRYDGEWGWDDDETNELSNKCWRIARNYEDYE